MFWSLCPPIYYLGGFLKLFSSWQLLLESSVCFRKGSAREPDSLLLMSFRYFWQLHWSWRRVIIYVYPYTILVAPTIKFLNITTNICTVNILHSLRISSYSVWQKVATAFQILDNALTTHCVKWWTSEVCYFVLTTLLETSAVIPVVRTDAGRNGALSGSFAHTFYLMYRRKCERCLRKP